MRAIDAVDGSSTGTVSINASGGWMSASGGEADAGRQVSLTDLGRK